MQDIIKAQGGDPNLSFSSLTLGKFRSQLKSRAQGRVVELNNRDVSVIARILGSPHDKKAGLYLERKLEDEIDKGDILCTLYSSDKWRLQEATETIKQVPIYRVE
jgi:AMP phosphorylase